MANPPLFFNWLDDDRCIAYIGGEHIISINYDDHGRGGMRDMIRALTNLALHFGLEIYHNGDPGVRID